MWFNTFNLKLVTSLSCYLLIVRNFPKILGLRLKFYVKRAWQRLVRAVFERGGREGGRVRKGVKARGRLNHMVEGGRGYRRSRRRVMLHCNYAFFFLCSLRFQFFPLPLLCINLSVLHVRVIVCGFNWMEKRMEGNIKKDSDRLIIKKRLC